MRLLRGAGSTLRNHYNRDSWKSAQYAILPVRVRCSVRCSLLSPTVAFNATETMLSWRDNRLSGNGDIQARRMVFVAGLTEPLRA